MQNRFRFRVWNKKVKKMYDVKSMSYIDGVIKRIEVQGDIGIAIFDEYGKHIDNCVLMQCTGLKDHTGKLIYDGDIVKINADLYEDLSEEFFNECAVVSYDETRACWVFAYKPRDNSGDNVFSLICDYYYFLKWSPCGDLPYNTLAYAEIIGNMYENEDLYISYIKKYGLSEEIK